MVWSAIEKGISSSLQKCDVGDHRGDYDDQGTGAG
jgi:hypothetical protein